VGQTRRPRLKPRAGERLGDDFLAMADRVASGWRPRPSALAEAAAAAKAAAAHARASAARAVEIDPFAEPPLHVRQLSPYAWSPLPQGPRQTISGFIHAGRSLVRVVDSLCVHVCACMHVCVGACVCMYVCVWGRIGSGGRPACVCARCGRAGPAAAGAFAGGTASHWRRGHGPGPRRCRSPLSVRLGAEVSPRSAGTLYAHRARPAAGRQPRRRLPCRRHVYRAAFSGYAQGDRSPGQAQ
jgi:hypothetical protein